MLAKLGIAADLAGNGQQALEKFPHGDYALVLMDCQMPVMDGFETTRRIRELEASASGPDKHVPIVAVTASAMVGTRKKCLVAGMDDYLSKPIKFDTFKAVVEHWLPAIEPSRAESDDARERPASVPLVTAEAARGAVAEGRLQELREVLEDGDFVALLETYCQDMQQRLRELRDGMAILDREQIQRLLHLMKGSSANIGASGITTMCEEIADCWDTLDETRLWGWLGELEHEYARVQALLRLQLSND
jgi:CheY-like chemotaxis protein